MIKGWGTRAAIRWAHFWMRFASLSTFGRIATRIATSVPLPYLDYYVQQGLAHLSEFGYIAGSVRIHHDALGLGRHVFINDGVCILRDQNGGPLILGDRVWVGDGCVFTTGQHGSIEIGALTSIGRGCGLVAYLSAIRIGAHAMIAANCHFYSYNHGIAPGVMMQKQPLGTKGDIVVEDDVWIGTGSIILSGVRIGTGAVVGAGAVVTRDVPAGTIVAGNPARVVRHRDQQKVDLIRDDHREAIILRRLDGTIKYWNSEAAHLYGWEPEEAIDKQSHSLLNTKFPQPLGLIQEQLILNGHWEGTLVHLRRDGVQMIVRSRWELRGDQSDGANILEINRLAS